MKYIITESQLKKLINEQSGDIDSFINELKQAHPDKPDEFYEDVKSFILKSDCNRIEFANFKLSAGGLSLHDRVLINKNLLRSDLGILLFVIFHEIAHQYQFKKYGADMMYKVYNNQMDLNEAANYMAQIEMVADEFGTRKVREFIGKGFLNNDVKTPKRTNLNGNMFYHMIKGFREQIDAANAKSPMEITEWMYNLIKEKL